MTAIKCPSKATSAFTIREYRVSDVQRLSEIYLSSRRATFDWIDEERFGLVDFHRDTVGERIKVIERAGEAVGFSASWLPKRFIHHLYVAPAYTGEGGGSLLLAATVEMLGRPVALKCLSRNRGALRFYLSRGWSVVGGGRSGNGEFYRLVY